MKTISEIIEDFILENLGNNDDIDISRNELASYFNCAPSQINYVLNTRFTLEKGFETESKRGGGGFIRIIKLKVDDDEKRDYLRKIDELIGDEIDSVRAEQILENLLEKDYINDRECKIMKAGISKNALISPFKIENYLRAKILRQQIYEIYKEG